MFKKFKSLLVLSVVLLMVGASVVWAQDPATTDATTIDSTTIPVPLRVQVREILEKYPEALAEIEALHSEIIARPENAGQEVEGLGGFGFFGARMAQGRRGFMMNCWGNQAQQQRLAMRGMGSRWFR